VLGLGLVGLLRLAGRRTLVRRLVRHLPLARTLPREGALTGTLTLAQPLAGTLAREGRRAGRLLLVVLWRHGR
jgi:hypothetical protein